MLSPADTMVKNQDDANNWSFSQSLDKDLDNNNLLEDHDRNKIWNPPPSLWLKCNFAYSWFKKKTLVGMSWVLQNHVGRVILHSRHALSGIKSLSEAKFHCFLWSINSMLSLHVPGNLWL